MRTDALLGGFADPPREAARAFRAALDAMSQPGTIRQVIGAAPPAPLSVAAGVLLLVLADRTTPLHLAGALDRPDLRDWIAFHCGAPLVGPEAAMLALGDWAALTPAGRFATGTAEYPDRAATLIVEMPALLPEGPRLTGPGIATAARMSLPEVAAFRANHAQFPCGFDCFFTCGDRLAALPRSTVVEDL
jgi:alpha-D-ribose 1-methylphosphonate 5-triphosphate synthase subunit PhnH